jgi:hypothetical protein
MTNRPINSSQSGSPEFKPIDVSSSETSSNNSGHIPPSPQDTWSNASTSNVLKPKMSLNTPNLPPPETKQISFTEFLNAIGSARLNFQHILQKSELADIETSYQGNQAFMFQMQIVAALEQSLSDAIEEVQVKTAQVMEELEAAFEEAQALIEKFNALTKALEAGNAEEKAQFAAIHDAYESFKKGVEELQLVDNGNGSDVSKYTIPNDPEVQEQYNQLADDYNQAINTFNAYITDRSAQVQAYNQAADQFNAKINELNQIINQVVEEHGLPLAKDPLPLAETRDISIYQTIPLAEKSSHTRTQVVVHSPPINSEAIAKSGPAPLKQFSFTAQDLSKFESVIYDALYAKIAAPLQEELNQQTQILAALSLQANQPYEVYSPDPYLNRKPISQLLLPESNVIFRKKEGSYETEIALEKLRLKIESERDHARKATDVLITESFNKRFDEKKVNDLKDTLALLTVDQLGRHSVGALISSIQQIGSSLTSLPKDSPVFVIVFGLNFVKNALQAIQSGQTSKEISDIMDKIPEFSSLDPSQKKSISSGIIANQLLIAGKLLESNLGIPGLLTHFLTAQIPNAQDWISQTSPAILSENLKVHFLNQGYSEDKADFLAKMGSNGVFSGTFLAAPLSTITSRNINLQVLIESLTASLILLPKSNLSLTQAASLAEYAASRTLARGPFKTSEGFRRALESEFKDLGLKNFSENSAKQAILIPKIEAPAQLNSFLISLTTPHIGKKPAENLAHEVSQTFADLTQSIQMHSQGLPQNGTQELFFEGLNNSQSLYSFLSTLNNPASLFIYSLPNESIKNINELSI